MNLITTLESIEICRRALSAEAYQDYTDAMQDKDPHAALRASDISGEIDRILSDLRLVIEEYEKSKLND